MMKSPEELKEQVTKAIDGADTVVVFAIHGEKLNTVLHGDPVKIVNVLATHAPKVVERVFRQVGGDDGKAE